MSYVDTLTLDYGQALTMMKLGKIVESDHVLYKMNQGKVIGYSIIGLHVWLEYDPKKLVDLKFKEYNPNEIRKLKCNT